MPKKIILICVCGLLSSPVYAGLPPDQLMSEAWPSLSLSVKVWSAWLGIVTIASVFFVRRKPHGLWITILLQGLFVTALLIVTFSSQDILSIGLLSTLHVVFWTPVVILITRNISNLKLKTVYGAWSLVLMLSLWISLIFDFQAAAKWLFG